MSHMKNNITLIDDLPDLEDLENKPSILNREQSDKVKKFIRSTNKNATPYEAGMKSPPTYNPNGPYPIDNSMPYQDDSIHQPYNRPYNQPYNLSPHYQHQHQHQHYHPHQPYQHHFNYDQNYNGDYDNYIMPHSSGGLAPNSQMFYEPYTPPKQRLTCAEVADHSSTCSVCSKLYNNDRTIFIVIIVILVVICLFMLKKILNL